MQRLWILVNIGCIECGVTSNIVGVFDSEDTANHYAQVLSKALNWREHGENAYEVFPMPPVNEIAEEYRVALETPAEDHNPCPATIA